LRGYGRSGEAESRERGFWGIPLSGGERQRKSSERASLSDLLEGAEQRLVERRGGLNRRGVPGLRNFDETRSLDTATRCVGDNPEKRPRELAFGDGCRHLDLPKLFAADRRRCRESQLERNRSRIVHEHGAALERERVKGSWLAVYSIDEKPRCCHVVA